MLLRQHERAVIERKGITGYSYKVAGPGRYIVKLNEQVLTRFHLLPRSCSVSLEVRSQEGAQVRVIGKVLYRVEPGLIKTDDLVKVPGWNDGVWDSIVQWRTEAVLCRLCSHYTWREIGQEQAQNSIERRATQALAERLKLVGLAVVGFTLIKTELPAELQVSITQHQQEILTVQRRAAEYQAYADLLGLELPEALRLKMLDEAGQHENSLVSLLMLLKSNILGGNGQDIPDLEQLFPTLFKTRHSNSPDTASAASYN